MGKDAYEDAMETIAFVEKASARFITAIVASLAMSVVSYLALREWAASVFCQAPFQLVVWSVAAALLGACVASLCVSLIYRKKFREISHAKNAEIERLKAEIKQANENSRIRKEARTLDGRLTVGMDGLAAFTRPMALAALDAADNGYVATADHPCVVDSIARGDGVFDYRGYYFGGARVRSDEREYRITRGWYEFLNERDARDALKDIASGKR